MLVYNFARPGSASKEAGGVGVYLQSLIPSMLDRGLEVVTLSAGEVYSPWSRKPYLSVKRKGRLSNVRIINSPVIAPSHENFFNLSTYTGDRSLDDVAPRLRELFGVIDIFHFHNVEGLTVGFFRALRFTFSKAKIIFSAHNYGLVCPQMNLWRRDRANCNDYEDGRACITCIGYRSASLRKSSKAAGWFKSKAFFLPSGLVARALRALSLPDPEPGRHFDPVAFMNEPDCSASFRDYRKSNIDLANECFDLVLAVSRRTKDVLCRYGIDPARVRVSYIGSSVVDNAKHGARTLGSQPPLRIAFLGYARRDKGFEFLLDALEALPASASEQISILIAARVYDERYVYRLRNLRSRFASLTLVDGYRRDELPTLLKDVHLGIVPPLWEDCLPQVAIEFVARSIPILCSDTGGASELSDAKAFTFESGSTSAFVSKICAILDGTLKLNSFWRRRPVLVRPEGHADRLLQIYTANDKG